MKKIVLCSVISSFFFLANAQETHEINWALGISQEDASLTIEVGDTVLWTWSDDMPHDVNSEDENAPGDFGSEILTGNGNTYEYTFTEVGSFDYNCSVHPVDMIGNITIEEEMSVDEKFIENLKYYPNPARDNFTITSLYPITSVQIVDTQGKQVFVHDNYQNNTISLDISNYKSGIYFVSVKADKQLKTFQIIKK